MQYFTTFRRFFDNEPAFRGAMAALSGTGLLRKVSSAFIQQVVTSAFHFSLNLFLIIELQRVDYGIYALSFSAAVLATTLSGPLVSLPFLVHAARLRRKGPRAVLESVLGILAAGITVGLFGLALILALCLGAGQTTAFAIAAFIALWSMRGISKHVAFSRGRQGLSLAAECLYVAAALTLIGLERVGGALDLDAVLLALAAGLLLAATFELAVLGDVMVPGRFRLRWFRRYRPVWRGVRWALCGATTTAVQGQAHGVLISLVAGPAAYAPIAAATVLFAPLRVATTSWLSAALPDLSASVGRGDRAAAGRMLLLPMAGVGLLFVALIGVVAGFWDGIHARFYGGKYDDAPMAAIVAATAAIALVAAVSLVSGAILQARREFKQLAKATVWGALVSTTAVAAILLVFEPAATLAGVLLAEAGVALYLSARAWGWVRR